VFGVPFGISFFGTAFSEPTLIKLASGYEAFTQARANNLPTFAATMPDDHIAGTTPSKAKSKAAAKPTLPLAKPRKIPHTI
jgi:amidase